jgi:hypothetical protein
MVWIQDEVKSIPKTIDRTENIVEIKSKRFRVKLPKSVSPSVMEYPAIAAF